MKNRHPEGVEPSKHEQYSNDIMDANSLKISDNAASAVVRWMAARGV